MFHDNRNCSASDITETNDSLFSRGLGNKDKLDKSIAALARAFSLSQFSVEKFNGSDPEIASTWLSRFEKFNSLHNYSEEWTKTAFSLWLDKNALQWHEAQDFSEKSWKVVKTAFLARYKLSSAKRYERPDKLYNRTQKQSEDFEDFLQELQYEAKHLDRVDDNFIMDAIIRNSQPHIKQFILTRLHGTKDQVLESARIADAAFGLATSENDRLVSVTEELVGQVSLLTSVENTRTGGNFSYEHQDDSMYRKQYIQSATECTDDQHPVKNGTQTFHQYHRSGCASTHVDIRDMSDNDVPCGQNCSPAPRNMSIEEHRVSQPQLWNICGQ
ncbi:uncharacterized protein [Haliotis cracherodii]|uniref:uncharacterized protein n=1 Tax=Haliotis cracherodii TaxID=6455 RepID=UPI0039EB2A73